MAWHSLSVVPRPSAVFAPSPRWILVLVLALVTYSAATTQGHSTGRGRGMSVRTRRRKCCRWCLIRMGSTIIPITAQLGLGNRRSVDERVRFRSTEDQPPPSQNPDKSGSQDELAVGAILAGRSCSGTHSLPGVWTRDQKISGPQPHRHSSTTPARWIPRDPP